MPLVFMRSGSIGCPRMAVMPLALNGWLEDSRRLPVFSQVSKSIRALGSDGVFLSIMGWVWVIAGNRRNWGMTGHAASWCHPRVERPGIQVGAIQRSKDRVVVGARRDGPGANRTLVKAQRIGSNAVVTRAVPAEARQQWVFPALPQGLRIKLIRSLRLRNGAEICMRRQAFDLYALGEDVPDPLVRLDSRNPRSAASSCRSENAIPWANT